MLQIHYHPISTYSRRVRIALLEKDVQAELIEVEMIKGAHRQPPYLALHPYGRVPTLVDGDFVLPESTPILEYLEAVHPQPPLVPGDPKGRALCALHMKLCDLQFAPHVGTIIFAKRFLPKERWREDDMAKAKKEIEKHLPILDRELEGKTWLVGERFSLAEVCYAPFLHFLPLTEVTPPPNVASWRERVLARPSVQATVPAM